jgi:hypothetical protein
MVCEVAAYAADYAALVTPFKWFARKLLKLPEKVTI